MKCVVAFDNEPEAKEFLLHLPARRNPELLETIDMKTGNVVYIILYLPPEITKY